MRVEEKKVNVIGLGYVGLPSALLLAQKGFNIVGTDISVKLINKLATKEISFDELEIEKVYLDVIEKDNLKFSCKVERSDFYLICVPTPCDSNNKADLSYVYSVVDEIIKVMDENNVLIIESTIPVGTCNQIKEYIKLRSNFYDPNICHCPERVIPGSSIKEILNNDRVIGGTNEIITKEVEELYNFWTNSKITIMSSEEAELVKLIENSFRDVNIAFANSISRICDSFDFNSKLVINAANLHPRVSILNPGIGVGGHCIPVDPYFLIDKFPNESSLLKSAREINEDQIKFVSKKLIRIIKKFNKTLPINLLGFSYKPNTSDIRESPSIAIAKELKNFFYSRSIYMYEPNLNEDLYLENLFISCKFEFSDEDINVILVDHRQFQDLKSTQTIRATDIL